MTLPKIVSQEEWTAARRVLLEKEKRFTRQRDELNTERRELPMVEVTEPYEFEGKYFRMPVTRSSRYNSRS